MTTNIFGRRGAVQATEEFRRIRDLPRETATEAQLKEIQRGLTESLKTSRGTQSLRPIQAYALYIIATRGGMFGAIGLGRGKTLISLLAPHVLGSRSAILILPAALKRKTEREINEYHENWLLSVYVRLVSYEELGRVGASTLLENAKPDVIIADEVHKLKNPKAACTKRVARYMNEFPDTKFIAMTGSPMKDSIKDFAHVLAWCLGDQAPVPMKSGELLEWSNALDQKLQNEFKRLDPGPILQFANQDDLDFADTTARPRLTAARLGFQRRMVQTPGVVATADEMPDCRLTLRAVEYDTSTVTEEHYLKLRKKWLTPDDRPLIMATEVWAIATELALGFHYVQVDKKKYAEWRQAHGRVTKDPHTLERAGEFIKANRPPIPWQEARKEWAKWARSEVTRSNTYDSELALKNALRKGEIKGIDGRIGNSLLDRWEAIKPTCETYTFAVWHDTSALDACVRWLEDGPGIIWCHHRFFAAALAERAGIAYFGADGQDTRRRLIDNIAEVNCTTDPKGIIASISSNAAGRNLQRDGQWSRNLVASPPTSALTWEQMIGRTHREGQSKGMVTVDMLVGCREHWNAVTKALADAQATMELTGLGQRLLLARIEDFPDEGDIDERPGGVWGNVEKDPPDLILDLLR